MINPNDKIVICGAGGFIGGHLVKYFYENGYQNIIACDIKKLEDWFQVYPIEFNLDNYDLRYYNFVNNCVNNDTNYIFNLAADMGGMGFIENNKSACMTSVLINTNLLFCLKNKGISSRYFYSSSACVYRADKQNSPNVIPLKEEDAYPATPEDGYGWEKLFSERMCRHYREDFGIETKVARFHNVYGPYGTFEGGREKAPAAICRKVIEASLSGNHEIEIWGDGSRTRSFMYIDDCIDGILKIINSNILEPINLGSSEIVTINQLIDIVEDIANIKLKRIYNLNTPQGVQGRNSDNTKIREYLDWEPSISLKVGMEKTYRWIYDQISKRI